MSTTVTGNQSKVDDSAKRRALGKGLAALIPGAELKDGGGIQRAPLLVPVDSISPNPYQPREGFSEEAIDDLVCSITQNGILQPLLVRRRGHGYQLIAGERRWRAARKANLERVPVIVREVSDAEALELALVENLQREGLNALEEAAAYRRLMEEFGLTQDEVARRVSKSRSAVANALRLLALPPAVQAEIRAGRLSAGHARAIAGAPPRAQAGLARQVIARRLSVRETEQLARQAARDTDWDRAALEDRLRRALGTKVRVVARSNGSGRVEIEYYSLDELQGLVDRLAPGTA